MWHIDESQQANEDENHYLVALVQADGPATSRTTPTAATAATRTPGGRQPRPDRVVEPRVDRLLRSGLPGRRHAISDSGDTMTAQVSVHAAGGQPSGDLEARVAALEARVDALQSAVASAAQALGSLGQGVRGDSAGAGWRRPHGRAAGRAAAATGPPTP